MAVNKAILLGRLGQDPELKYTQTGTAVCKFSLATSENWTNKEGQRQEKTVWHNIVSYGRQAEVMKEYLSKGREVFIEGRIDNRQYEDKEGQKRNWSEVVVQSFSFVGGRGDAGGGAGQPSNEFAQAPPASTGGNGGGDDDLPF